MAINNVDKMGYDPEERLAVCERFLNSLGVETTSHTMTPKGWTVHGFWHRVMEWGNRWVVVRAYPVIKGGSDMMLTTVKCSATGHPRMTFTDMRPISEYKEGRVGMPHVCGLYGRRYCELMMVEDAI